MVRKNLPTLFTLGRNAAPQQSQSWTVGWSVAAAEAAIQRSSREPAKPGAVGVFGLLAGVSQR